MPTNTYVALATAIATGSQSTITFTSIPQTYTDLVLVCSGNTANVATALLFNNDNGTNYSRTAVRGYSSTADSFRQTSLSYLAIDASVSQPFQNAIINIQNYSNTTTRKTALWRSNSSTGGVEAMVGLWYGTIAAINRIDVISTGGTNFSAGSTFTIYGIAAASVGAKATGGTIYTDSLYYYHAFAGNGTFTPTQSISADILQVAGGGGGAGARIAVHYAGGGGAGGVLGFSSQALTATNYTVTVGGGGAGGVGGASAANGTQGGNSQFASLTASVGGGSGSTSANNGGAGGSGGGGGSYNTTTSGGAATSGQGFAGGGSTTNYYSGGGGGAGAVGTNGTGTTGSGYGGAGTNTVTNLGSLATMLSATGIGVNGYIAGGGQGSAALVLTSALGGGGIAGADSGGSGGVPAVPGVAYTGSGGGAGSPNGTQNGANGGSGIVIVRYLKA
jgi:hypothetical protein